MTIQVKSLEKKFELITEKKGEVAKMNKKVKILETIRKPISIAIGILGAILCSVSAISYILAKYGALSSVLSIFFATILYVTYGFMAFCFLGGVVNNFIINKVKELKEEKEETKDIIGRTEKELSQYRYCKK